MDPPDPDPQHWVLVRLYLSIRTENHDRQTSAIFRRISQLCFLGMLMSKKLNVSNIFLPIFSL
jgi:hypothetical protein